MAQADKPFRHDERYTDFLPRVEVIAPPGSKRKCYLIDPEIPSLNLKKVWVGYRKSDYEKIVIDRL